MDNPLESGTFFDIGKFIPFVIQFLIIFGLSYQLPIVMWVFTVSGMVDRQVLETQVKVCGDQ